MASLTITIPDAMLPRVVDGFAANNGYTGTNPGGGAETKQQFLKRAVIDFIRQSVVSSESNAAAASAAATARTDVQLT